MKYILLFLGIVWLLSAPIVVLWFASRADFVKRHGNAIIAVYLSLVLAGWLLYFQRNHIGFPLFAVVAGLIFMSFFWHLPRQRP